MLLKKLCVCKKEEAIKETRNMMTLKAKNFNSWKIQRVEKKSLKFYILTYFMLI